MANAQNIHHMREKSGLKWTLTECIILNTNVLKRTKENVCIQKMYHFLNSNFKTRQDKIYFESARHITINVSPRALLNRTS